MNNDLVTRNMLDKIWRSKFMMKESENESDGSDLEPNEADKKEELEKFGSQITSRVNINSFNIYPKENNVTFGGSFTDIEGFTFLYDLKSVDGVYISTNNVQITETVLDRIKKLRGYYLNWSEEWAKKIINDYGNNED